VSASSGTNKGRLLSGEKSLLAIAAVAVAFAVAGSRWQAILGYPALAGALFVFLFGVIVLGAVAVVRHADHLAVVLGEPYGTLILTLSIASIEIMTIAVVMLTGEPNPMLARDTMFSVVMIVCNGLIGVALLLGGLRYREQEVNLQGVNAYLSVIVSLAVFGLIMPNYTLTTPGPTFSRGQEVFLIAMCVGLYAVFLAIQTTRHRSFFLHPTQDGSGAAGEPLVHDADRRPVRYHVIALVGCLALVIYLTKQLAILLNHGLDVLGAPPALGALLIAVLVLAPEGLGGIKAALANRMQRSINIFLGSVLATLALTIPSVVILGLLQGKSVVLGLEGTEEIMLALTLLVSLITFTSGRTNVLQGAVHVMLFLGYLMLIIWR
jgi:Ca2+:H+ antiporter